MTIQLLSAYTVLVKFLISGGSYSLQSSSDAVNWRVIAANNVGTNTVHVEYKLACDDRCKFFRVEFH